MQVIKIFFNRMGDAFSAVISAAARLFHRSGGYKAKNSKRGNGNAASPSRVGLHVYRKTTTDKTGFKAPLWPFLKKRRVWMIAAACAIVAVVTIVLVILLGTNGAQAVNTETSAVVVNSLAVQTVNSQTDAVTATATPLPTTALSPMATTAPEVSELIPGCHDERIIEVQEKLMELGYLGNDEPTDYYGYGTQYALQLFQRKHSLQVDGILGEQTMTILFSADAAPYTVRNGDSGTDVEGIQERLKELKYFSGEITGDFGDRTETAVINFQKRNGLSPDGIVGEGTREVLFSGSARPASGSGGGGSSGGSSGSHGGGTTIATWEPDSAKVEALISFAQTLLGKKYVLGAKGPETFDCSGFVYYCLNHAGYSIGYMTSSGWANCSLPKVTSMSDMRRGDIICFKGHVGIYLGNGQMIDASSTQGEIRISTNVLTSSYWKRNFICARRVF